MPVAATTRNATHAYRREARRVRGRLPRGSAELYRSLRQLSDRHDAQYAAGCACHASLIDLNPGDQGEYGRFASEVATNLAGGVLSYSKRLELLDAASRHGIGRFQANLVVAAVQHRMGMPAGGRARCSAKRMPRIAPVLVAVVLQSLILALAWNLFIR